MDSSIVFEDVTIGKGAVVRDSIIMPGAKIEAGAAVQYAIIGEQAVIKANAEVGKRPEDMENLEQWGLTVVGGNYIVAPNTVIPPKTMLDADDQKEEI